MKIIRLSTFLDFGGIESKMINLSHWEDEHEWMYVALNKGGFAETKIKENKKKVYCLQLNHKIPSIKTVYQVYKFLKKEKPDILHTSGAEANFFGFLAGKLAGIPKIVVEEIGIPRHSFLAKICFGFIFRNADKTIGESKIVVDYLVGNYHIRQEKTSVVSNFGVFDEDLSKIQIHKDPSIFNLLMISRLDPVKNIEGVLRVVSRLVDQTGTKIKLTIAGSGILEKNLKASVKKLNLEETVVFTGFVTDPYTYLVNSDLYLLNSFSEGFSNSLLEAMYSKTLSLSTNVGAAPEIIEDGINGFLVPADDEDALYEKIKIILETPPKRRIIIGLNGHRTIIENFSLEKHIAKLMKIYKSPCESNSRIKS